MIQEQQSSQENVNDLINSTGFYFNEFSGAEDARRGIV
jgi:hypothetical protein